MINNRVWWSWVTPTTERLLIIFLQKHTLFYSSYTTTLPTITFLYWFKNITLYFIHLWLHVMLWNVLRATELLPQTVNPSVHGSLPYPLTSMTVMGRNPAHSELKLAVDLPPPQLNIQNLPDILLFKTHQVHNLLTDQEEVWRVHSVTQHLYFLSHYLLFHTDLRREWTGWRASWCVIFIFSFLIVKFQSPLDLRNLIGFTELSIPEHEAWVDLMLGPLNMRPHWFIWLKYVGICSYMQQHGKKPWYPSKQNHVKCNTNSCK